VRRKDQVTATLSFVNYGQAYWIGSAECCKLLSAQTLGKRPVGGDSKSAIDLTPSLEMNREDRTSCRTKAGGGMMDVVALESCHPTQWRPHATRNRKVCSRARRYREGENTKERKRVKKIEIPWGSHRKCLSPSAGAYEKTLWNVRPRAKP